MEAWKVYQWLQVHLREAKKRLHISMLTEEGEREGRGSTDSYRGDGPRTGRTLPSNTSSPNSDGLCNT